MRMGKALLAVGLAGSLVLGLQASAHAKTAESDTRLAVANTVMSAQAPSLGLTERPTGAPITVTVASGDTLSGLVARHCGRDTSWQVVFSDNAAVIGTNPNLIYPGQRLWLNCGATGEAAPAPVQQQPAPAPAPAPAASSGWVHPLPGACVTSPYGWRQNPTGPGAYTHQGVDIGGRSGAPIRAAHDGQVLRAGWNFSGYGISVLLNDQDGTYSHYAHMSQMAVSAGQWVSAGETIGYVGATGDVTGPHLHFEIWFGTGFGTQRDPAPVLRDHGVSLGC